MSCTNLILSAGSCTTEIVNLVLLQLLPSLQMSAHIGHLPPCPAYRHHSPTIVTGQLHDGGDFYEQGQQGCVVAAGLIHVLHTECPAMHMMPYQPGVADKSHVLSRTLHPGYWPSCLCGCKGCSSACPLDLAPAYRLAEG